MKNLNNIRHAHGSATATSSVCGNTGFATTNLGHGFGHLLPLLLASLVAALPVTTCRAQVLLSDDFSGTTLDTTKWRIDNQPFESGTSDIAPTVGGGFLTFSGTDTAGWWGGSAIATVATFKASPETNLVFKVDRVSEGGVGTATRSAIWITDASRQHFVFFGDDRGESNWRYNRKIGADGDNPTGSGTIISAFANATFTDLGLHTIKAVVNGQSVKLYLDDVFGAEVAFPFSDGIVFEIGSYARAVGDIANSTFANASITAAQTVMFTSKNGTIQNTAQVLLGQTSTNISVKIPAGQNATQPFTVRVTTSEPTRAVPVGATGDTLSLTFPAGGPTIQDVPIRALKNGGATLTLQNDAGILIGNELTLLVPYSAAGVLMQDDFSGTTYDTTKWQLNTQGFETGVGSMTVTTSGGQLKMSGGLSQQYWGGVSLKTLNDYIATKDLPIVFEVDRVSLSYSGTAARTGVFITTADRSRYVFFGQNRGETGWEVNVNPGNPTGSGTAISAFSSKNNGSSHHLKLVADGSNVEVFLDGVSGGRYPFAGSTGIYFEVGTYARAAGDTAQAAFDNVKISTQYSPVSAAPAAVVMAMNQTPPQVVVSVSPAMVLATPATITVTSRDPSVAIPTGATGGKLDVTFPAGGSPSQSFTVTPIGVGTTTFDITNTVGAAVANNVQVTVTEPLFTLLSDDFSGTSFDATKWRLDQQGLEAISPVTNGTYVAVSNGTANIKVVSGGVGDGADIWWGGMALATKQVFSATPTAPVSFEIDRVALVGTGAERRSAVLIADSTRQNWVMFSDDDLNGGWVVDLSSGTLRQSNTGIAAFADPKFRDGGKHRMKLLANGSTVKLYLDGVFGVEVPFALQQGIIFEFGAYARSFPDSALVTFDNTLITGPIPAIHNTPTTVTIEGGQTTNEVVTVTLPVQLHQTNTAHLVVTSSNPSVAIPVGGSAGSLTLSFAPGASDTQSFEVARVGSGIVTFTFSNDMGVPSTNTLLVVVQTAQPKVLFSDNFEATSLSAAWTVNPAFRFEPAYESVADATATINSGVLELNVTVVSNYWPGIQITTVSNFQASLVDPIVFQVDRVLHLGQGTGTRSGVFIYAGTNYVWFGDDVESGLDWGYNYEIGRDDDRPGNSAVPIAAFDDSMYRDGGIHHMKLVADGQTVSLFLDGVFGTQVPFPFSSGLKFALHAAGRAEGDTILAQFDNVVVSGSDKIVTPVSLAVGRQNGGVLVSWTGSGTLEEATSPNGSWTALPTATSPYTIPANALAAQKFYRLRY